MARPPGVDVNRAGDLLTELVQIPSVNPAYDPDSPGEQAVAQYLAAHCAQLGMETLLSDALPGRPNLTARLCAPRPAGVIVFEVHTDTVGLPTGTHTPDARIIGGRLYGRGACDAKGGLAAVLLALAELAASPDDLNMDVVLLGAVDEEHQYRGVLHYVDTRPDATAAIVVEPTGLAPVISHSGCVRMRITVAGQAAHSSRPSEGRNAIMDAYAAIQALRHWNDQRIRTLATFAHAPTLSVNRITGGHAFNIVPDRCAFDVDIRTLPSDEPHDVVNEITQLLDDLEDTGVRASITDTPVVDYGLDTPADHPLVHAVISACKAHRAHAIPQHVTFGTDASKLSRRGGVPSVVLGPGSIAQAHTDDEWINLIDVVTAASVYAEIVRQLSD